MPEVLRALPEALRLRHPRGWDKFDVPKVEQWFREVAFGSRLEVRVPVLGVQVERNRESNDPQQQWRVRAEFGQQIPFALSRFHNVAWIQDARSGGASSTFSCDERTARRWEELERRKRPAVNLTGDIAAVTIDPFAATGRTNGYRLVVQLLNVTVALPGEAAAPLQLEGVTAR